MQLAIWKFCFNSAEDGTTTFWRWQLLLKSKVVVVETKAVPITWKFSEIHNLNIPNRGPRDGAVLQNWAYICSKKQNMNLFCPNPIGLICSRVLRWCCVHWTTSFTSSSSPLYLFLVTSFGSYFSPGYQCYPTPCTCTQVSCYSWSPYFLYTIYVLKKHYIHNFSHTHQMTSPVAYEIPHFL